MVGGIRPADLGVVVDPFSQDEVMGSRCANDDQMVFSQKVYSNLLSQ